MTGGIGISTTGSFNYQGAGVPRGSVSTGLCYLQRDETGSDSAPVGLDQTAVTLPVHDGRGQELSLDTQGFVLVPHAYDHIEYMNETEIVSRYYDEVCELVKRQTGATKVVAFDHNIRASETKSWMNESGAATSDSEHIAGGNKVQSPAQVVHNDYTLTSAPLRMSLLSQPPKANDTWAKNTAGAPLIDPLEIDSLKSRRYAFINVWRSISDEPVTDMPLALCDGSTVRDEDLVTFEIRYADRVGENYFAGHSDRHKWLYFPLMTKDEAILLKVWDSHGALCTSDPRAVAATFSLHSAFSDPAAPAGGPKRRSIEVRAVAFF